MNSILLLAAAGFGAGAMNALAGGGSFVSLPALIAAGVPPVQANASSTVALFPGGLASAWAYRDGLQPGVDGAGGVPLKLLLMVTVLGGVSGALLLLYTSSAAFGAALPWLMLVAFLTLAFGKSLGARLRARWHLGRAVVLPVQFALGVYGGYFGGAVGIMMIAVWGLLEGVDPKRLNARRTLMVSAANLMAVVTFICAHAVYWEQTLAMLIASIVGGYAGAQLGRRTPGQIVRIGTLMLTAAITVWFFVRSR